MYASPSLLQTDLQHSALAVRPRGAPRFIAYTVYGASPAAPAGPLTGFDGIVRESFLKGYLLGNGYRVYSPLLMRFYSADQMSPFERGGINTYAYCHGDPVNFRDDSGRAREKLGRKISTTDFRSAQLKGQAVKLKLEIKTLDHNLKKSQEVLSKNIDASSVKPSQAEISLRKTMVELHLRKRSAEESLTQISQELKAISPPESSASSDTESSGSVPPSPGVLNVETMIIRGSSNSADSREASNRFF
ncbi:RHS repeat-associated core domain-containing protein [Pseudomonas sp. CAM1A]|uniref:RHS repeat-associated core domain-containing protein n=1 Tax=Pseudomonas sp. CAM1A TaxID=3231717 RepID=UPI0039C5B4C6